MHESVVLGVDFGGSKIALAVSDTAGHRLAEAIVATSAHDGGRINLERGITAARTLLDSIGLPRLVAVGACTFGIPGETGVELAPAIPGWAALSLRVELEEAFPGAQVRLATDVKAAAHAEAVGGALVGCDPGIYLNLGTGLAVAVVVNGSVIGGRNGASGEIGYSLRHLSDVGRPAAERVILEEAVSGMALRRLASASSARQLGAAEVFAGAADDPALARLAADFLDELAYHLVNLAIAIDPARIVVGGGMAAAWDQMHGGLRRALDAAVPFPPELTLARFPFDAPLRGAIALGLAAARHSPDPVNAPAP